MAPARRGQGQGRGRGRGRGGQSNLQRAIQAMDNMEPPEDFRALSVFPTVEDLQATSPPFVRRNLPKGAYKDHDHYLDVQFRLMREDFVCALREGLADYRINLGATDDLDKFKKKEIKVYNNVTFKKIGLTRDDLSILIEFDPREVPNPENAFMNGSLLCFSTDNFEDIIFATVAESFPEGVSNGNIRVKLNELEDILEMSFGDKYTMVEPDSFFDPYHHVMCALQTMALDEYPMRDFIVGSRRMVAAPRYLSTLSRPVYNIKDHEVALFDDSTWPSAKALGLNQVQLRAFKLALCSELALIQGPPGTGKTYLGVEVVRTLIENLEVTGEEMAPILVICATNHALDQFLEHLTTVTSDLVRCGSQSQSSILEPFLLSKRRRQYKNINRRVEKMAAESQRTMNKLISKLRGRLEDIGKIVNHRGIISLQSLSDIIGSQEIATFRDGLLGDNQLLSWLEDRKLGKVSNANLTNNESHGTSWISYVIDLDHVSQILKKNARQVEVLTNKIVRNKHGGNSVKHAAGLVEKLKSESEKLTDRRDRIAENLALDSREISKKTAATYKSGNAWELPTAKRWLLYHHWTSTARSLLEEEVFDMINTFAIESNKHKACKMEQDLEILKDARVVGMTTSCSARLRPLLDNLKPKIMVVEEAAEVLEGHIVASLTRHCQHVILIGDHQQLRPKTSSNEVTYKYKMDVSLFERLLNNGLPCVTLQVQHRMKPEIARLIVPTIYPHLTNHHTVSELEDVIGMDKNMFFITHSEPDELASGMSRKNVHEAELLIALCRYLLHESYTSDKITIIATYAAQVAEIQSERDKHDDMKLKSVRVSTVDGYQGEENAIILLSLVRSNKAGNIGFLKAPNRVCVALSRARNGLYIVGNMECLTQDKRSVWGSINQSLVKQQAIGTHLPVRCVKHKRHVRVSNAADFHFDHIKENGCPLDCEHDDGVLLNSKQTNQVITREFFNTNLSIAKKNMEQLSDGNNKENRTSLSAAQDLKGRSAVEMKPTLSVPPLTTSKVQSVPPTQTKYATNKAAASENYFDAYFTQELFGRKSTTQTTEGRSDRLSSQHFFSPDYGRPSIHQPSLSSTPSVPLPETQLRSPHYQNTTEITRPPKETDSDVDIWTKYFGDGHSKNAKESDSDVDTWTKYFGEGPSKTTREQSCAGQPHVAAVEPPVIPSRCNGAIPKSSSTSFAYVNIQRPVETTAIPTVSRLTPSVVSQEVPRATSRVVPQEVPRVTSRVVPQEVPRVPPRVAPQVVPRATHCIEFQQIPLVTSRGDQQKVEFGDDIDVVLGIHRRPPVWQAPAPQTPPPVEKKKKKCIIM